VSVTLALRPWQQQFAETLADHAGDDFLMVAAPASGKTIAAAAAVPRVMRARACDQLVVVCPTVVVRDQWAAQLARLGYRMQTRFATHHAGWADSVHGICATYQQVAAHPGAYARACRQRGSVVILDEIHHAADRLCWGQAIQRAFASARLRLALSGTPFRSDRDRIPFVAYDGGRCVPDFSYGYAQAVGDGLCRGVVFRAHGGVVSWREGDGEHSAGFAQRLAGPAQARRLRAALDPSKPYMRSLLAAACEDLRAIRATGARDAGGLVLCDSQAHAHHIARVLGGLSDRKAVVAVSDDPGAHRAIRSFVRSRQPWLVAVRMVAEGVDIPRLRVIAWATTARTELMVRQGVGRALRARFQDAEAPRSELALPPEQRRFCDRDESLARLSRSTGIDASTLVKWMTGRDSKGKPKTKVTATKVREVLAHDKTTTLEQLYGLLTTPAAPGG